MEDLRLVVARSNDLDRYRSYLLRLWREAPGAPWRCQVHSVGTGLERCFAGLAEAFDFLVADVAGGCWADTETKGRGDIIPMPFRDAETG